VANVSESFSALATRLHVHLTKLYEYNFLYDCKGGVNAGDSLRVPYDQCTPKPGAYNCYEVKAGDTLLSVATGNQSVVADPVLLKSANLGILYGGDTILYPGQHLRLPIHNCFEDEVNECYIVVSPTETLQSVSALYNMTPETLCKVNAHTFGRNYCDPSIEPLPTPRVGMELTVSRLHPTPPSPCKEMPGYWTCYTVKAQDTLYNLTIDTLSVTMEDLIELNFGKDPNHCCDADEPMCGAPSSEGGCSNTSACPPSKGPYPECLQIGQVLVVRINKCTPKPGAWGCIPGPGYEPTIYGLADDLGGQGSPLDDDFFCSANRHSFVICRKSPPAANLSLIQSKYEAPTRSARLTSTTKHSTLDAWVKAPLLPCIPNDKSYILQ
jgi:LysM repeat protein